VHLVIQLDLTAAGNRVTDSITWDLTEPDDQRPEIYAERLVADLGLSPTTMTPIIVALRSQILSHWQVCCSFPSTQSAAEN
jgi:hypothetical protein